MSSPASARASTLLGVPYFTVDHVGELLTIAVQLKARNRSLRWLESLVKWANQDTFLKKRLGSTHSLEGLSKLLLSWANPHSHERITADDYGRKWGKRTTAPWQLG